MSPQLPCPGSSTRLQPAYRPDSPRLPRTIRFSLTYTARYIRKGRSLVVDRELVIKRKERFCQPSDEYDWLALTDVMKRDLRSQVFIR